MEYSRSPLSIRDPEYKAKVDLAIALYKKGEEIKDLAEYFDVHNSTVIYWLKRSGVERRDRRLYHYDLICDIGYYWEETSIPLEDLAKKYKISKAYLRNLMFKYGFQRKNPKPGALKKKVSILKIDMQGNVVERYESINEASRVNQVSPGNIGNCVNHKNYVKSVGGYRYVKESEWISENN